jgi:hypothetical protein
VTIEQAERRTIIRTFGSVTMFPVSDAPSSWLARLRAATVRFLVKMAFFSAMAALGWLGGYWIPDDLPVDTAPLRCLAIMAYCLCGLSLLVGGLVGLGLTVFTAGRRPRWD